MLRTIIEGRMLRVSVVVAAMLVVAAIVLGGIGLFRATTTSADDDNKQQRIFRVVAISDAGVVDGVHHRIGLNGDGMFTANHVNATGSFVHFDQNTAGPGVDILASGTWRAGKVLSYERGFGTAGEIDSGILEMEVDLFPDGGPKTSAVLRVVCNIGFAGISTGEPEGYVLTVPSAGFTFSPLVPALGLTHISVPGSR